MRARILNLLYILIFVSCYEKTPKEKPFVFEEKYPEIAKAQKNRDPNPHIINNSKTALIYFRPDAFARVVAMETKLGTKMEVTGVYPSYDNPEFFEVLYGETNKGYVENSFVYFEYSNRGFVNVPMDRNDEIALTTREEITNNKKIWSNIQLQAGIIPEESKEEFIQGWIDMYTLSRSLKIDNGYVGDVQLPNFYELQHGVTSLSIWNEGFVGDTIFEYVFETEDEGMELLVYKAKTVLDEHSLNSVPFKIEFDFEKTLLEMKFKPNRDLELIEFFVPNTEGTKKKQNKPVPRAGDKLDILTVYQSVLYDEIFSFSNEYYFDNFGYENPWLRNLILTVNIESVDTGFSQKIIIRNFNFNTFIRYLENKG